MTKHPNDPGLIDHIGVDLWRATQSWKASYRDAMVAEGFYWFAEARGNLIRHISRAGITQNKLAARAGITKQAVQQQLDDLERDGIITRSPDPDDARRKLVTFTDEGFRALTVANRIKRQIEAEYRDVLGAEAMTQLVDALRLLVSNKRSPNG